MSELTALEQSLADFCTAHSLTTLTVGYRNWPCAKSNPFEASMHFDNARPGEIPCASEGAPSLAEALSKTLAIVEGKRAPLSSQIDDALPEVELAA